jgi:hypothetical protein
MAWVNWRQIMPKLLYQVWAIRFWLDREHRLHDRAMLDLAIGSKLRGCDIVKVKIGDLVSGGRVRSRVIRRLLTACGSVPAGVNRSEARSPPLVLDY